MIDFIAINVVMNEEYRERIIKQALISRKKISQASTIKFNHIIQKLAEHELIKGHRPQSAYQAPVNLLVPILTKHFTINNSVIQVILQAWVESDPKLVYDVSKFIGVDIDPTTYEIGKGFQETWTREEMEQAGEHFIQEYHDYEVDDVLLMLCCLYSKAPLSPEEINTLTKKISTENEEKNVNIVDKSHNLDLDKGDIYFDLIKRLEQLPLDSREWEVLPVLLERIEIIKQTKILENKKNAKEISEILSDLGKGELKKILEYLEIYDYKSWNMAVCSPKEYPHLFAKVSDLKTLLLKYNSFSTQIPKKLSEEKTKLDNLTIIASQIKQVVCETDIFFKSNSEEPNPKDESGKKILGNEYGNEKPGYEGGNEKPRDEGGNEIQGDKGANERTGDEGGNEMPGDGGGNEMPGDEGSNEMPGDEGGNEMPGDGGGNEKPGDEDGGEKVGDEGGSEKHGDETEFEESLYGKEIQKESSDKLYYSNLLFELVAEGDLSGAYWLARSAENQKVGLDLPSWLIKAMEGAFRISSEVDTYAGELLDITINHSIENNISSKLFSLAAALIPSLYAPYTGLINWVNTPEECQELQGLITAVQEFAGFGTALHREDIHGLSVEEQYKIEIESISNEAKTWINNAGSRKMKFFGASEILVQMSGSGGSLRTLLDLVVANKKEKVKTVEEQLNNWKYSYLIQNKITEAETQLRNTFTHRVEGGALDQLVRVVNEARDIAQKWVWLISQEDKISKKGNSWISEKISILCEKIEGSLPEALKGLQKLSKGNDFIIATSVNCLQRAILDLVMRLGIQYDFGSKIEIPHQKWELLISKSDSLTNALSKRLLLYPDLELKDDRTPKEQDYRNLFGVVSARKNKEANLLEVARQWISKQDFRFMDDFTASLIDQEISIFRKEYQEELEGARTTLSAHILKTKNLLEQAVVDGIITEGRSELSAVVELMEPKRALNIYVLTKELELIATKLDEAREEKIEHLKGEWKAVKPKLIKYQIENAQKKEAIDIIEKLLLKKDNRLIEEYLSQIKNAIDMGSDLDESFFSTTSSHDPLFDFLHSVDEIDHWLEQRGNELGTVAKEILQGQTRAGIHYAQTPDKRREEASNAITSWRSLKQKRGNVENFRTYINSILRFLSFSIDPDINNSVIVERSGNDWLYAKVKMFSANLARPIMQFGSQANGQYEVVCLWERRGADSILARMNELRLQQKSVLLFFLGRLTRTQRSDLVRIRNDHDVNAVVLDEELIIYLCQEKDVRLPSFLKCTLPFTSINPYTPYNAGDVPEEMFFGREKIVKELQEENGGCLIYGGRQLGKSALLRKVQRDFNNPGKGQFSWVEDIKLIGGALSGQKTDSIWIKLRDRFIDCGLFETRVSTEKPEEIERYIRESLIKKNTFRVLILFDEADNFLKADAKENFKITERLRVLMFETNRKFKVVFAGLHHVQRYQGIPNQPLAHFGTPISIGPLEPDAAQKLINQPLEYLGYRFEDETGPLKILSYTNYHPGLIQLFCQELLKSRPRSMQNLPPYIIKHSDIELVYRHIKDKVKERFDWTLALDVHYQAIAWALIQDQIRAQDSYSKTFSPSEILKLAQFWWANGFKSVSLEELRGLLSEMVGLGVLIKNSEGKYILRSPNLVRLMGSEKDIETQLLELIEKPLPVEFEADFHHALISDDASRYSPFTYAQERRLNPHHSGVGLILSSRAQGFDNIQQAIVKFTEEGKGKTGKNCIEIPIYIEKPNDTTIWLVKQLHKLIDSPRIVAYQILNQSNAGDIQDRIEESVKFTEIHESKNRTIRVFYIFEPGATWIWQKKISQNFDYLENIVDAVEIPQLWNSVGIQQRLVQNEKMDSTKICNLILSVTGGWPILLDRLFGQFQINNSNPTEYINSFYTELIKPSSSIAREFVSSLGLSNFPKVQEVLRSLIMLTHSGIDKTEKIPISSITYDLFREVDLTDEYIENILGYLLKLGCLHETIEGEIFVDNIIRRVFQE